MCYCNVSTGTTTKRKNLPLNLSKLWGSNMLSVTLARKTCLAAGPCLSRLAGTIATKSFLLRLPQLQNADPTHKVLFKKMMLKRVWRMGLVFFSWMGFLGSWLWRSCWRNRSQNGKKASRFASTWFLAVLVLLSLLPNSFSRTKTAKMREIKNGDWTVRMNPLYTNFQFIITEYKNLMVHQKILYLGFTCAHI